MRVARIAQLAIDNDGLGTQISAYPVAHDSLKAIKSILGPDGRIWTDDQRTVGELLEAL